MLDAMGNQLTEFRTEHQEVVPGPDGEYEIDVTARFSALGMDFLVLVECKYHKNPIKREALQALHSKMLSVGAQKGAVFSVSGFQSGALDFATAHGIATVLVVDGRALYVTNSEGRSAEPPPWADVPPVAGWLIRGTQYSVVSAQRGEPLSIALGFGSPTLPSAPA